MSIWTFKKIELLFDLFSVHFDILTLKTKRFFSPCVFISKYIFTYAFCLALLLSTEYVSIFTIIKKTSHDSSCFPTRNNIKALNKAKTFTFSKALAEANFSRMTVIYVTFNSREYSESAVFFFFASHFDTVWLLVCAKRYIELFYARCKHKNSCFSVNILRAHQKCGKYWDWLTPHFKKLKPFVSRCDLLARINSHTGRERERERRDIGREKWVHNCSRNRSLLLRWWKYLIFLPMTVRKLQRDQEI